jgi:3-dehydroquinate synthase
MHSISVGSLQSTCHNFFEKKTFSKIAILVDRNTERDCLPRLLDCIGNFQPYLISIPSGEFFKNIDTCQVIWKKMLDFQLDRKSLLINLGGGVIGDMGGFCAATFKRGISFVQIPTTLLSMVDASVGGKLGIDLGGIKNSVGVFRDPEEVWIDPFFLNTLPIREIRSGFAEMIKHALIADIAQWESLKIARDLKDLEWPIWIDQSVEVKKRVVVEDPFEKSLRKILNFGHTIGHAVESIYLETENPLLHGEAIAVGMVCETFLSYKICGLPENALSEICEYIFHHFGHHSIPEESFSKIIYLMGNDKKNEGDRINFALLKEPGKAVYDIFVDNNVILESLTFYNSGVLRH